MFFTRKKNQKRLWGLRVNTSDRASSSPDPPHLPPSAPPAPHHHHHHYQQQPLHQPHHPHPHHHHLPPTTTPLPLSGDAGPPVTRIGRKSTGVAADGGTSTANGIANSMASAFMNCCGAGTESSNSSSTSISSPSWEGGCIGGGSPMDTSNNAAAANAATMTPVPVLQLDGTAPPATTAAHLYAQFCALVKRLKEPQMLTLCQALEHPAADGGPATNCVLVPRDAVDGEPGGPHVLACRLWRWPDVRYADELRRLPACPSAWDPVYECCNPSHWSRQMLEETPPPPYLDCLFAMDRLKPEDQAPSEERLKDFGRFPGSPTTEGEDSARLADGWCQLAYWELSQRVGQLFPVANAAINVFAEQPRTDGLCLATLAAQRRSATPDAVLKARSKIGLGVTLSREADGVWLYNRSAAPVFVHSPTLNDADSRTVLVYRVPPGHCLRAFDHEKAASELNAWSQCMSNSGLGPGGAQTGPIDIYSVRISFAKGWGPKYQRQEVTACPCWLEVHLSRCR